MRSVTCLDTARIAKQARDLADKATRLAAESIPLALDAACEMHELADDIDTMAALRHTQNAHDAISEAFARAMGVPMVRS